MLGGRVYHCWLDPSHASLPPVLTESSKQRKRCVSLARFLPPPPPSPHDNAFVVCTCQQSSLPPLLPLWHLFPFSFEATLVPKRRPELDVPCNPCCFSEPIVQQIWYLLSLGDISSSDRHLLFLLDLPFFTRFVSDLRT